MTSSLSAVTPSLMAGGWALVQVIMIDLIMAGDNAVAVGMAAAGLPPAQRRKAIAFGLVGAVVTRILFVLLTVQLLKLTGLALLGGLLLLVVAWKMAQELNTADHDMQEEVARAEAGLEDATGVNLHGEGSSGGAAAKPARHKSLTSAIIQILIADVSMSLDNVLAVSGAASRHVFVLVGGLLLSIALMGVAAHLIASVLHRYRWIAYVGLLIIIYVALRMIWDGGHEIWTALQCQTADLCRAGLTTMLKHVRIA